MKTSTTRRCAGAEASAHGRQRLLYVALIAGSGALACADEPAAGPPLAVIEGCEAENYAACDVLDASCQERVFAAIACLRQMPDATQPEVRVITRDEYEALLSAPPMEEASTDTEGSDTQDSDTEGSPAQTDEESAAESASVERALVLLGLAQPADLSAESVVALYSETVPGYFSNDDGFVTLIDDPEDPSNPGDDTLLLAHEFLHALQNQEFDLGAAAADDATFDRYLATISVIEGEAAMFQGFFGAAMWQLGGDIDFRSHYTAWIPNAEDVFADQSPLLVGPRYFPYSYGARFVYELYEQGGVAAIRELYSNFPSSVLPMLPSDGSSGALIDAEVESLDTLLAPAPATNFRLVSEDSLGPWVFGKFLQRSLSQFAFDELASHWRGDRFFVYAREASVTGVWAVQLDDVARADQLRAMVDGGGNVNLAEGAFGVVAGRNVAITVTDDGSLDAEWLSNVAAAQQSATGAPPDDSMAAGARLSSAERQRLIHRLEQPWRD